MSCPLAAESKNFYEKFQYNDAEKRYYESLSKSTGSCTLVSEIAKARQHIKSSLERMDNISAPTQGTEFLERISTLEKDNQQLRGLVTDLQKLCISLQGRLDNLEKSSSAPAVSKPTPAAAPAPSPAKKDDDDDGVDLFGSDDEEDEAAAKVREERLAAYAAKKSKKPALIAKSSVTLDVKPWDDETDMKVMEQEVRKIQTDGLLWGASKLVPLAFGIHKLQILCIVEDEKVSIDWLTEEIEKIEDFVQSVDIAAFNKI